MKGNQYLFIFLHLRKEYRLVKVDRVDIVTAGGTHDLPIECCVLQNARVQIATWGQEPITLDILDTELICHARRDDVPLHSKRRGSSGKH
jgi:hypothetical protein